MNKRVFPVSYLFCLASLFLPFLFIVTGCGGYHPKNMGVFELTFSGRINGQAAILDVLNKNGNISGQYFFKGDSSELVIEGEMDEEGHMKLREFSMKGTYNAEMDLQLADKSLKGTRTEAFLGHEKTTMELKESLTSYEEEKAQDRLRQLSKSASAQVPLHELIGAWHVKYHCMEYGCGPKPVEADQELNWMVLNVGPLIKIIAYTSGETRRVYYATFNGQTLQIMNSFLDRGETHPVLELFNLFFSGNHKFYGTQQVIFSPNCMEQYMISGTHAGEDEEENPAVDFGSRYRSN